jgi:hypothetical protein
MDPGAAVKTNSCTVLTFPCASNLAGRRARKDLLSALRISASPVILDLSGCGTLNHQDIDLLLECVAQVAGRDTNVLCVVGSGVTRVLLDVTRISSLVPVFNSVQEALTYPQIAGENVAGDLGAN